MGGYRCPHCEDSVDLTRHPLCPTCLARDWLATDRFVREKHDPGKLPLAWESYRSVLNPNLVADPLPFLLDAATRGQWFHDSYYDMYVHMCFEPLGVQPGAGIPEGAREPEHGLDSLVVAEANSKTEAHAFAVSRTVFEAQVEAGEFVPLATCERNGCGGLQVPGSTRCTAHTDKPDRSNEA